MPGHLGTLRSAFSIGLVALGLSLLAVVDGPRRLVWLAGCATLLMVLVVGLGVLLHRTRRLEEGGMGRLLDRERFVALLDDRDRRNHSAVAILEIRDFRGIHDLLGHEAGELLLGEIGGRLRDATRETDAVGHLEPDRFAVHLADLGDDITAAKIVSRLVSTLAQSLEIRGLDIEVEASAGIAVFDGAVDGSTGVHRATVALEAARSRASVLEVYRPEHEAYSEVAVTMLAQVRSSLAHGHFEPFLQPVIDTASGRVIGFEALVRWRHPERGLIPPALFLQQIENLPVGRDFTDYLLDRGLEALHCLARPELFLSFNLSRRDVEDLALPMTVQSLLAKHQIGAARLTFEVAERVGTGQTDRIGQVVRQLGDLGCGIAIDDFGAVAVPVDFLASIPATEIKIDARFVASAVDDPRARAVVQHIVGLGHGTGLRVTAKGIEREAVFEEMIELGCDAAQGFHFAPPMSVTDAAAWMANDRIYR